MKVFLKEKKKKKQQYGSYKILSEDAKQKLAEYTKKISKNEKKHLIIIRKNYFRLKSLVFWTSPGIFFSGVDQVSGLGEVCGKV